jgi:hypothetical protein
VYSNGVYLFNFKTSVSLLIALTSFGNKSSAVPS